MIITIININLEDITIISLNTQRSSTAPHIVQRCSWVIKAIVNNNELGLDTF